ncbi:MAG: iron chelate uptake ABC transporter family permease subunit [Eubacteriales bacterium]
MEGTVKSGKGRCLVTLLLVLLLIAVSTISVTIGAVNVSAGDIGKILVNKISGKDIFRIAWEGKTENIIWNIRFPRVLMAFIVGAGLALCGVLMQAPTKNPLADPYVLGISSGASAGAVCAILLGGLSSMGGYSVIFGATAGAAVSIRLPQHCVDPWSDYLDAAGSGGYRYFRLFFAFTNLMVYGINTGSDKAKMALYWMVAIP